MARTPGDVVLYDTIAQSVTIRCKAHNEWDVCQRHYGEEHDNNQNPTWLRIENAGRPARIRVRLRWAQFAWMSCRRHGYLKQGRRYSVITGRITPTETHYEFVAPAGTSWFGAFPWYTNEDADRFMKRMVRKSPACRVRSLGQSGEGRDIKCLTIESGSSRKTRPNVVVIGRMHATEPSGSFAVDGTGRFLLSDKAPRAWLRDYAFHLIPVVNPDGTANGLKLTRPGSALKYDMVKGGTTSDDPTIRALRDELHALRPACLVSHHCYLMSFPFLGFFETRAGLDMTEALVGHDAKTTACWLLRKTGGEPRFLRYDCYKRFGTTAIFTELPWQGRLPREIESMGAQVFQALMHAHVRKTRAGRKSS